MFTIDQHHTPMPHLNNDELKDRFHALAGLVITLLTLAFLFISNQIVLLPDLPNWYDQQRFLMLLLLAAALFAFAKWPSPQVPGQAHWLIAAAVVLSARSPLPGWAFAETTLFLGLLVTAYWVSCTLRELNQHRPDTLIYGLIVYATLLCLPPLMQFCLSILSNKTEFALSTLFSGFSNHRFFSQAESFVLPLMTLPAMLLGQDSRWRKLGNVAACLLWVLAFAAGTRAFYVAIVAGLAFSWIFNGQTGLLWSRWQIKFAGMGLLGYLMIFKAAPWLLNIAISSDNARLNEFESALNSSGRLDMWIDAGRLISEHPLTGIGPMHFATRAAETGFVSGFAAHPHSSVIQLLVEWGLPMGLTLLCLAGMGFLHLFRAARLKIRNDRLTTERHILTTTLFTGFVYSLLDGSIVTPYTQVLLAFVIGLAWSETRQIHGISSYTHLKNRLASLITRLACIMASIYLIWLGVTPYQNLSGHIETYTETYSTQTLWPRFWSQGLINLNEDKRYPGFSAK